MRIFTHDAKLNDQVVTWMAKIEADRLDPSSMASMGVSEYMRLYCEQCIGDGDVISELARQCPDPKKFRLEITIVDRVNSSLEFTVDEPSATYDNALATFKDAVDHLDGLGWIGIEPTFEWVAVDDADKCTCYDGQCPARGSYPCPSNVTDDGRELRDRLEQEKNDEPTSQVGKSAITKEQPWLKSTVIKELYKELEIEPRTLHGGKLTADDLAMRLPSPEPTYDEPTSQVENSAKLQALFDDLFPILAGWEFPTEARQLPESVTFTREDLSMITGEIRRMESKHEEEIDVALDELKLRHRDELASKDRACRQKIHEKNQELEEVCKELGEAGHALIEAGERAINQKTRHEQELEVTRNSWPVLLDICGNPRIPTETETQVATAVARNVLHGEKLELEPFENLARQNGLDPAYLIIDGIRRG
jgi:hypothetical protein